MCSAWMLINLSSRLSAFLGRRPQAFLCIPPGYRHVLFETHLSLLFSRAHILYTQTEEARPPPRKANHARSISVSDATTAFRENAGRVAGSWRRISLSNLAIFPNAFLGRRPQAFLCIPPGYRHVLFETHLSLLFSRAHILYTQTEEARPPPRKANHARSISVSDATTAFRENAGRVAGSWRRISLSNLAIFPMAVTKVFINMDGAVLFLSIRCAE